MTATVGFLIIGNEILSGRTVEKNLPVLANLLAVRGLKISQVCIVRDTQTDIVSALGNLQSSCDYVFTSGGIGSTHDDITTVAVSAYLKLPVEENPQMLDILSRFCQSRELPLTAVRRRMARAPVGAKAVLCDFSGAPGYTLNNIFVCAGVPGIFTMMVAAAVNTLPEGIPLHSQTLQVECPENNFAEALALIQDEHNAVEIGSYPRDDNGLYYCHLIFSGTDKQKITAARQATEQWLTTNTIRYKVLATPVT